MYDRYVSGVIASGDVLGVLALVWVVYLFLLDTATRIAADVLGRLKGALSTNKQGFDLTHYSAYQFMGVREILDLQLAQPPGVRRNMIESFRKAHVAIERGQAVLTGNLFLVTGHGLWRALTNWHHWWQRAFIIHIGITFMAAAIGYLLMNQRVAQLKFIEFIQAEPSSD